MPRATGLEPEKVKGPFSFQNGALLNVIDFGDDGNKLSLSHPAEEELAVILPPAECERLAFWLMDCAGSGMINLPARFLLILRRIVYKRGLTVKLEYGDKAIIAKALSVIKI